MHQTLSHAALYAAMRSMPRKRPAQWNTRMIPCSPVVAFHAFFGRTMDSQILIPPPYPCVYIPKREGEPDTEDQFDIDEAVDSTPSRCAQYRVIAKDVDRDGSGRIDVARKRSFR